MRGWVRIGQIRTLSVKRLGSRIGKATAKELDILIEGLNETIAQKA